MKSHPAIECKRLCGAIGAVGVGLDVLLHPLAELVLRTHWSRAPAYDAVRHSKVVYEQLPRRSLGFLR